MKLFIRLPIYRRLFVAFFLATLIPDLIMVVMSLAAINVLTEHGVGAVQRGPLVVTVVIALSLSTVLVVALGYVINLTITQPLLHLVKVTRQITNGETSIRTRLSGRDEIALVADSINHMLDHIVLLMQESRQQRDTLQSQVERLVREVSVVGEGDLRIQAEVTYDALGVLADSFNYMIEALSQLIGRVKLVADEVQRDTQITSGQMTMLVQQATGHIQQIEVATTEVLQMASASREMATLAQGLHDAAVQTNRVAHTGRNLVEQMSTGMEHVHTHVAETARQVHLLDARSHEINEVVEVISALAHQTNRLALDASIQAVMAGEHGKGFGAVAEDIRRLAERTKAHGTSISRMVKNVQGHVDQVAVSMQETEHETCTSSQLLRESAGTFEEIFGVVEQQAADIAHIHQKARHQLTSSQSIVEIMQVVRVNTQQRNVTMRTLALNMDRLTGLLEQLRISVEAFKVKEDANTLSRSWRLTTDVQRT